MAIIRVNNYLDAYRLISQSKDVHDLSGRHDKKMVTEFVNRKVLQMLQPEPNDLVVDIGCGDASLLRMMDRTVQSVGIVATIEEQWRLESTYPDLSIKAGEMQSLPLDSRVASKIVCNGVLFYLQSESEVRAALSEIKRIARSNALILLGEIPEVDEYKQYGMYRGHSMVAFLWHLARRNGLRAFLGMIRRWLKATFGKERIVLNSAGMFYARPETMVKMAESCGLVLKTYFRHQEIDQHGKPVDSPFRFDYLFTV
jgi:hypothetical protein